MSNKLKIWLLILALALVGVNAGFFLDSSHLLDGLTTQLEDEELSPEELARVTETARTSDVPREEKEGNEGSDAKGHSKTEQLAAAALKSESEPREEHKLAINEPESGLGAKEVGRQDEKESTGVEVAEESETGAIKSKYRPKLIGQCKSLYAKYVKKGDFTGNHRAFTYSYDGNSGNCAIVEEQKSKQIAEKEALKACEKSKTDAATYAPCFVMASF